MDLIAVGALGELIATAVTAAAGKSWRSVRSSPEAKAVKEAIDRALIDAFEDAYQGPANAGEDWARGVAEIWLRAFTSDVSQALIACLASTYDDEQFAVLAAHALRDSGCDIEELQRTFWVDQFLYILPRVLFKRLKNAALESDSPVRDMVGHLLEQRAEERSFDDRVQSATPREFVQDVIHASATPR